MLYEKMRAAGSCNDCEIKHRTGPGDQVANEPPSQRVDRPKALNYFICLNDSIDYRKAEKFDRDEPGFRKGQCRPCTDDLKKRRLLIWRR